MGVEEELFLAAMRRLRVRAYAREKPEPAPSEARAQKKKIATPKPSPRPSAPAPARAASGSDWQEAAPGRIARSGVPADRVRALARGDPAPSATLDLHGMTRDEAWRAVERFLHAQAAAGARVVRIIHGRGLHSGGRGVLKEALFQWLKEAPWAELVLAAAIERGSGGGATIVLLRRRR
ncbi:MAG: hypothetical protein D6771_02540 [Zetaproteobacteria bacterium]|nr:MAG: hypothetical protein D6771_02540 [Zetaproteobacteria bacterium]